MAVTVSIPTILRTHTGGEKSVEAKGSTVAEVIDAPGSTDREVAVRPLTDGDRVTAPCVRPPRRGAGGAGSVAP